MEGCIGNAGLHQQQHCPLLPTSVSVRKLATSMSGVISLP